MRMKKTTRVKTSRRSKKPTRFAAAIGRWAIPLGVMSVMGVVMLVAVVLPSQPVGIAAAVEPRPESGSVAQAPSKRAAASKPIKAAAVPAATLAADVTAADAPVAEWDSAEKASVPKPAPVTITGCLELDDETYRLNDPAGVDVPRARSWKSGFLKKGSASIELVDALKKLRLPDHVGQRVSVTGMLVDHEMHVRALRRVASSCKQKV